MSFLSTCSLKTWQKVSVFLRIPATSVIKCAARNPGLKTARHFFQIGPSIERISRFQRSDKVTYLWVLMQYMLLVDMIYRIRGGKWLEILIVVLT